MTGNYCILRLKEVLIAPDIYRWTRKPECNAPLRQGALGVPLDKNSEARQGLLKVDELGIERYF